MIKAGDKYIIEIGEVFCNSGALGSKTFYRIKGFNTLIFDDEGIKRLTPIDTTSREQIVGNALLEWLGKEGSWLRTEDDVREWLEDNIREPFSETDWTLSHIADSPDEGIIERYIRLAKEMHRDISITINNDGTTEISLNIPTAYHSEMETRLVEESHD